MGTRGGALIAALVLAALECAAGAAVRQSAAGRIDIYAVGGAFELLQPRACPGASLGRCPWLGDDKALTGVSCQKRLGRQWEQLWVEFVPAADGQVEIDLQGEYYNLEGADDVRLVWTDDAAVEGVQIRNGGFEEAGPDGKPVGWRFTGDFPPQRYSHDGSVAHGGRACVAVWWGSQARQRFRVRAGQRYRVSAWFRVMDPGAVRTAEPFRFEVPMETYTQRVRLGFDSVEHAAEAIISIAPLFGGADWSVSCRWDDNNLSDLKMRDVMEEHGYRGNFYLNRPNPRFTGEVAKQLLMGGNAIGGHSMTHPYLSLVSKNHLFWEVAAVRMLWEAATDSPVCSYAFSFCDFRHPVDGRAVQRDIAESLCRAGYYHIANGWFENTLPTDLEVSPILPSDGAPIAPAAESYLADERHRLLHPHMSFSMHVWYDTPEKWARFETQLDMYGRRSNWWYCNQNEYAAYRRQYRLGAVRKLRTQGSETVIEVRRPVLRELNDSIPLSLLVNGVPADSLVSAECATARVDIGCSADGAALVQLHHDRLERLPAAIGMIQNEDNSGALSSGDVSEDFPGLRALLHFEGGRLIVQGDDGGPGPLEDLTITYRLPLAYRPGVVRHHVGTVARAFRDEVELAPATTEYKYTAGRAFFAAQLDFVRAGRAGRLHLGCLLPAGPRDPSYPQGGFAVLGPMAETDFDLAALEARLSRGAAPENLRALAAEHGLSWHPEATGALEMLDPEVVATSGSWLNREERVRYYLLAADVRSDRDREVGLVCDAQALVAAFLDGRRAEGGRCRLRAGVNRLLIVARQSGRRFQARNAGLFLRLVDVASGERAKGLRFQSPLPATGG